MRSVVLFWYYRQRSRLAYRRSATHLRQGNLAGAIAAVTQALPHHPYPAECYALRGLAHWKLGDLEAAIADYDRAIALDPQHVVAYGNRGLVRYEQGDTARAIADWKQALHHQPHYATAHYNLGLHYAQQGDYDLAHAALTCAIRANPNLATAYYHRGNVREALGDRDGAQHDWELAVSNDLSLAAVKEKLMTLRQARHHARLSAAVQATLPTGIQAQVRHDGSQLTVTVHRDLGVPINYFTLPNQMRTALITLGLSEVSRFQLVGYVADQTRPEWQQYYDLYRDVPCPPSYWPLALWTLLLFPPFGVLAMVYAAQVRSLYRHGHYPAAVRASNTVRAVFVYSCAGVIAIATLILGYLSLSLLPGIGPRPHQETPRSLMPRGPQGAAGWRSRERLATSAATSSSKPPASGEGVTQRGKWGRRSR